MCVLDLVILNIFEDFSFVLKIFFFIFIVGFIRQKITHNTIALILISIAVIFLIFVYWPLIGPMYFIYILITIGLSSVIVDFFFVSMGGEGPEKMMKGEGASQGEKAMKARDAVHTGIELQQRNQAMNRLRPKKPRPF